jgi:hypothetical protein
MNVLPSPSPYVALGLVHLGRGCPAGLEKAHEGLFGLHGDHLEIRVMKSVDRQWTLQPSLFHEVDQDPHMAAV